MSDDKNSLNQPSPHLACPRCSSLSLAYIVYGSIERDDQFWAGIRSGKIVFGNWIATENSPMWKCNDCGNRFGTISLSASAMPRRDDTDVSTAWDKIRNSHSRRQPARNGSVWSDRN